MRHFSVIMAAALLWYNGIAQDNIYNAYTFSKKLISLERKLQSAEKPGNNELKVMQEELQRMFGYFLWYADLQDYQKSGQKPRYTLLRDTLKKYTRLYEIYQSLYGILDNKEKLYSLSEETFRKKYSSELKQWFKDSLSRLFKKLDKLRGDTLISKIKLDKKSVELNEVIADTVQIHEKMKLTENLIDTSNVRIDSTKKLKVFLDSLRSLMEVYQSEKDKMQISITDNRKKIDTINAELDKYVESKSNKSEKIILYNNLNEIGNRFFHFEKYLPEEKVAQYAKEFQEYSESIISQSKESALQFKLPTQTEIIDAIAIYLAKRVKQEAIMWFFETIKTNAVQYELVKTFFPNTITLLQSNEVYEIPNLGSQWRYALSKDFVKMPRNVFTSDWFKKWISLDDPSNKLILEYLVAGFDIADLLVQRYSYSNLVTQMYLQLNSRELPLTSNKIRPRDIFSVLYAINQECFLLVEKNYRFLRFEDYRLMTNDEMEVMISLIDMKYGGAITKFWGQRTFKLEIGDVNSVRQWLGNIESGIRQFEEIQNDFNDVQQDIKDGKKVDAVFSLFNLWENVSALFDIVIPDSTFRYKFMKGLSDDAEKIKSFTKNGFEVYNQITLKNYAGAVNTIITILESFFYAKKDSTYKISVDNFKKALSEKYPEIADKYLKNYTGDSISFTRFSDTAAILFERDRHAIQLIRKLAGFLNDVMLSTDSKMLAKVVESYALPPQSYKRKRNSWWSLDLNAFVGAYGGYEIARKKINSEKPAFKSEGWVYGVTAPIGISLSKTFGRKLGGTTLSEDLIRNPDKVRMGEKSIIRRGSTSFTVTASIIDIGAVVSYRFNNTKDSVLPQEIKWAQVFSPGVHFSLAIRNTPLVVSTGYQYTPQLRKIDETTDPKKRCKLPLF